MLFRRLPAAKSGPPQGFSEIVPACKGGAVACLATGPSLTEAQIDAVRRARQDGRLAAVLVLNDNYRRAPFADVLYFPDRKWWGWNKDAPALCGFAGELCTLWSGNTCAGDARAHVLRTLGSDGLSLQPGGVATGGNSGHQLLNIAALSGATRIVLLGYDARRGPGGRTHWFGEHPDKTGPPYGVMIARMRTTLGPLRKLGVEVLNATPGSALDCFPMVNLESLLPDPGPAALPA